jgi:hypothetical protein
MAPSGLVDRRGRSLLQSSRVTRHRTTRRPRTSRLLDANLQCGRGTQRVVQKLVVLGHERGPSLARTADDDLLHYRFASAQGSTRSGRLERAFGRGGWRCGSATRRAGACSRRWRARCARGCPPGRAVRPSPGTGEPPGADYTRRLHLDRLRPYSPRPGLPCDGPRRGGAPPCAAGGLVIPADKSRLRERDRLPAAAGALRRLDSIAGRREPVALLAGRADVESL